MAKVTVGLVWFIGGFRDEVTQVFKNGKCRVKETWFAEDIGRACKCTETYGIGRDEDGEEYIYSLKYPNARPLYACGASNALRYWSVEVWDDIGGGESGPCIRRARITVEAETARDAEAKVYGDCMTTGDVRLADEMEIAEYLEYGC